MFSQTMHKRITAGDTRSAGVRARPQIQKSWIVLLAILWMTGTVWAASHREAPFITEQPKVDATDFYLFRSYEADRQDYVVLIADYLPLQAPYGGPNYFSLDPEALYEIHIDNDGDAEEDVTFQLRFQNNLKDTQLNVGGKMVSIPLINSGPITTGDTAALNVTETYTLKVVRGDRRMGAVSVVTNADTGEGLFHKPVDNIGNKSIPDYASYAQSHIAEIYIPGCTLDSGASHGRVFVGQRDDPFVVNLGEAFDLINTNPLGPMNAEVDILSDANVTSLILEVHQDCLIAGSETVLGGWTTASLKKNRHLKANATYARPAKEVGTWTQVSRLGNPLVNELVVGVKDKNLFNGAKPEDDSQFADYVTNPTFPAIIELLYPAAPAPTLFPRTDLVAVFLTGINTPATGNLNQPAGVVASEMLRLNTAIAPTPSGSQSNLGVIGGDLAGFPNGRRPGDDVVDIALRVVMGKLISLGLYGTPDQALAGGAAFTDGALANDSLFDASFPFLKTPIPGSPTPGTP
jgi:hypothetical protein